MALIKCAECNREISDTIKSCPHCGFSLDENASRLVSPQQVEITAIKMKNSGKIKRITLVILSFLFFTGSAWGVFTTVRSNAAEQERIIQRTEYIEKLNEIKLVMLNGAADAEQVCNLTRAVWRNTIYKTDDSTSNIFTKVDGKFRDDFNDSLRALYDNEITIEWVNKIKQNQGDVERIYKSLLNPTDEFLNCYNTMETTYSAYKGLTNLVISPSGSLTSYSESINKYDSAFMAGYDKLKLLIPEE